MEKNDLNETEDGDGNTDSSHISETIQRIDVQRRKLIAIMGGASTVAVTGCFGLLDGDTRRQDGDRITVEDNTEATGDTPETSETTVDTPGPTETTDDTPETSDGTLGNNGEGTATEENETTTVEIPTFDIEWVNEGSTIISVPGAPKTSDGAVPGNDSLLDNALDAGLEPPWQCGRGICGYCTSKVDGNGHEYVEHGKGEYSNQYLSDEQIEAGYVLTCVGWPKQDFSLETDMKDEADDFEG